MNVKVKGYLTFRKIIGERTYQFPDNASTSLIDFIELLAKDIGGENGQAIFNQEERAVGPYVAIMVNGQHYNHLPNRLETVLENNDEIAIFPPGAGGAFSVVPR